MQFISALDDSKVRVYKIKSNITQGTNPVSAENYYQINYKRVSFKDSVMSFMRHFSYTVPTKISFTLLRRCQIEHM